jgi:hypothetical protein
MTASPLVPVSWGELIDKLTILEIKQERIDAPEARANVTREYLRLSEAAAPVAEHDGITGLRGELKAVNQALWEIEDEIRAKEAAGDFGEAFVRLARSVYKRNDERAALKRELNMLLKSELVEEKSYAGTNPGAARWSTS